MWLNHVVEPVGHIFACLGDVRAPSPKAEALASLQTHQADFGRKGEYCSFGMVKRSFVKQASVRTTLGGCPIV